MRSHIMEEVLPTLELRGHTVLLNFEARPQQFLNAQGPPAVDNSGVYGEVLTQVLRVSAPERAPSQVFVRREVAPAPGRGQVRHTDP